MRPSFVGRVAAACSSCLCRPPGDGCGSFDHSRRSVEAGDTFLPFAVWRGHHHHARYGYDSWLALGRKCSNGHHSNRWVEGHGGGSYQGEASYTIRWGEGQEDVQGKLGLVEAALQPLSCRSRANGGREACLCLVMAPLWWIFLPLWKWKHCIMDDPANP